MTIPSEPVSDQKHGPDSEGGGGALRETPFTALHRQNGAQMAAFAGYDMPIQYIDGVKSEHLWTRQHAGLFDVSHMGPVFLQLKHKTDDSDRNHARLAAFIERLVPSDIAALKPGEIRYSLLLNAQGGVLDDLMIARYPSPEPSMDGLYVVVNAGCKEQDFALFAARFGEEVEIKRGDADALLALQGPEAVQVLQSIVPGCEALRFMRMGVFAFGDAQLFVSRSGYTGEDGFEILVPAERARAFADLLCAHPAIRWIGLGARDSLRLEAGLCLYGHDLDPDTTPAEADLTWTIQKRRRAAADFPGAERILAQIAQGVARKRVGLRMVDRIPAREGATILADNVAIGRVCSGGFGPSVMADPAGQGQLGAAIAMGYVASEFAHIGQRVAVDIRGKPRDAIVVKLPFVAHKYAKN